MCPRNFLKLSILKKNLFPIGTEPAMNKMKKRKRETREARKSLETMTEMSQDDPKDNFGATIVFFILCLGFLAYFLFQRFTLVPDSSDYYETNGMLAVGMLIPLFYVLGYFPEMLKIWKSVFKSIQSSNPLSYPEKEGMLHLVLFPVCAVVFFFIVDFSFLGVEGGIPRIGSVAALSMWGFFRNVYRLRKANRQERKRKLEHEKHIEEIRSRRNSPPGKQK